MSFAKSACKLTGFSFLILALNANNNFILLLISKKFHTTAPQHLNEFSSLYVEFTEGTYRSACKHKL